VNPSFRVVPSIVVAVTDVLPDLIITAFGSTIVWVVVITGTSSLL